MKKLDRLELALAAGAAAVFLYFAAPRVALGWWTTAFEPLCAGLLTDGGTGEVILRSRLWELLSSALG